MKKLFILFIGIAMITNLANAQMVSVSPALPTASDQVVITFNTSLATGQSILNYTGDVYVHTGVKVQGSDSWAYVKGSWGNNSTQPKLTKTGTYTYTLTISPDIRTYYAVPSDKKITKLCFVFRSSDATKQTSPDVFINVYEQGLSVSIISPTREKPIFEKDATIPIQVSANNSTELKVYIDNVEDTTTNLTSLDYTITAKDYGKHWIKAVATYLTDVKKDSLYYFVRPPVTTEDLPSGLKLGVNKIDNNTVTLVLNDPKALKSYCYAIGSFSKWQVDNQYYMKRTTDGKYYWLTITGLNPDKEYIYQYFIDGQVRLADPYCSKTSDKKDIDIKTNYPNLIAYPTDSTTGVASTFKINEEAYSWNTTTFTAPQKKDLVVYEMLIRDFTSDSYIKTAMDSISYLKKLGVNAIELMPISEFEGNDSWGYNPSFYFAPDKAYGTHNDYKAFIDECHNQGIAVIMDIVLNHSNGESPLVQMYLDSSTGKVTSDNPWYNVNSPNTSYSWGYDFNHESVYTKQFVDSVLTYWQTEYKFDGFRFDFSKGFTNTVGDGWAYDASRIAILKHYADKIWETNPNAYLILEHFCDNNEEKELADYGMMLWGNLNYNYSQASMGISTGTDFSGISYKNRGWTTPNLVGYMESHDEERMMYRNEYYGNNSITSYNIRNINIGLNRCKLAATFFFTVPGPKMIWQFGELGYDISIDYNTRTGRKPQHWEYFDDENRKMLFNTYAQLTRLKENYDVFKTNDYSTNLSSDSFKWIILNGSDMNAVVIGNYNVTNQSTSFTFPSSGKWYEYFTQDSIDLTSATVNFNFAPGEYRLYTSKRIIGHNIFPEGIDNNPVNGNNSISIWPNPNNGHFIVAFNSKGNESVTLSVFSIVGQKVYEQFINKSTFGTNATDINLNSDLSPGIYLVRLQTGKQISTGKIMVR